MTLIETPSPPWWPSRCGAGGSGVLAGASREHTAGLLGTLMGGGETQMT